MRCPRHSANSTRPGMPTPRQATTMCQPSENPICERAATGSAAPAAAWAAIACAPVRAAVTAEGIISGLLSVSSLRLLLQTVELLRDVEYTRQGGPEADGKRAGGGREAGRRRTGSGPEADGK